MIAVEQFSWKKANINNFECLIFRRYGDKTPRSVAARLFAVGWIMIGVTICSILTATLSSALTSVTVESVGVIAGIKVQNAIRISFLVAPDLMLVTAS